MLNSVIDSPSNEINTVNMYIDEYYKTSNERKNNEHAKGVIWSRKSKKDKQHNDQNKKDKRTNNDL